MGIISFRKIIVKISKNNGDLIKKVFSSFVKICFTARMLVFATRPSVVTLLFLIATFVSGAFQE